MEELHKRIKESLLAPDSLKRLELVSELGTSQELKPILNLVLDQETCLVSVASRSYEHPNGFDKLVLLESKEPEYKLRLHLWWPTSGTYEKEHIHNHRWDFWSHVITGSILVETFQFAESGERLSHFKSLPSEKHGAFTLKKENAVSVQALMQAILPKGTSYESKSTLLHRVSRPNSELSATLMLQGPFIRSYSDVLLKDQPSLEKIHNAPPLTPDHLRSKLGKFLESIS